MSRRYAILDSATMGANLSVEQSGEVLAIDAASLAKRSAVVDIGHTEYVHYAEVMFWTTDEEPADPDDSLTDNAAVGLCTANFTTNSYVGADAYSIGYLPAEGAIYVGGVSVASVTVGAKGDIIGVLADLDTLQLFFFLNGTQIHVHDLTETTWAGAEWFLGVSLGSDTEADMRAFVNTGQRDFQHPKDQTHGWFDQADSIATERVGTEDYTTATDDTPANTTFLGLIQSGGGFSQTRSMDFWTSGDVAVARPTVARIRLINERNGDAYRFDNLIADVRDMPVTLYEGDRDQDFDTFTTLGTFVVDEVEVVNDGLVELTLKSNEIRLDRPVQRKLFLPNAEGQAANRPVPLLIGAAFNIAPVLTDASSLTYVFSDRPLLGIGFVRDRGDALELDSSPVPFEILDDFTGITLATEPVGKLTLDASSIGGDLPTPPTNLAPANLAAWTSSSNVTETSGTYTFENSSTASGTVEAYLKASGVLTAGQLYRYTIPVDVISGFAPGTGKKARLELARSELLSVYPYATFEEDGTFSGTFLAGSADLVLRMIGTTLATDEIQVLASSVSVYLVDNTGVDSDNLLGCGLAEAADVLFPKLGFESSEWDRASAVAIDDATGYEIGLYIAEQMSGRDAFSEILPSFSACLGQTRAGVLTFFRLTAPEDRSAESQGEIGRAEILRPKGLRVRPYTAPGLCTRFGAKKNETILDPTDFVNDFEVTGATIETRRRLGRQYQDIVDGGSRLAGGYPQAIGQIHGTRLIRKADALTEVTRVLEIFQDQRWLYEVDVSIEEAAQYDLDQIWRLSYTDAAGRGRYGLGSGKYVCIWTITEKPSEQLATLTCFG